MADCNGFDAQRWTVANGRVELAGGSCLTLPNANAYNGAQPTVDICTDNVSQKWVVQGDHIKYAAANYCLDTPGGNTSVGTAMHVWYCDPANTNQMWLFTTPATLSAVTTIPVPAVMPSDPNRYLKAVGRDLRTAAGARVMLRGTNLGAWPGPSDWMSGISDSTPNSDSYLFDTLAVRGFTATQIQSLKDAYRDNWITPVDFDNMKSYDFNLVRVFFTPRDLQNADGSWKRDANGNIDFKYLDWIVSQANARGMYIVFVLSGWEGTRDNYGLISWYSPEAVAIQQKTATVWKAMARRYKGNSTIAGFDVLNEPTGSPGNLVHNTLYDAVRSEDPDRLVIMESTGIDPRWSNVMYSIHTYSLMNDFATNQATFAADLPHLQYWADHNVPLYIGEFMTGGDSWEWLLAQYNALGIHWSPFAYKTVDMGGWGLINMYRQQVNANTDSYETILAKFKNMRTVPGNYYAMTGAIAAQKAAAGAP